MNLSQHQLNVLMTTLPRMRMSHIIRTSQWMMPLESLLHIRNAGKNLKIAKEHTSTETVGVSQFIDEILKSKASEYIQKGKNVIDSIVSGKDNASEISATLKDEKYLKPSDNKQANKEIKSDMIKLGLNKDEITKIADYISLQRIIDGKYDSDFFYTIIKLANRLKRSMPDSWTQEDANNDIVNYLTTGYQGTMGQKELTPEQIEKFKSEGASLIKALDDISSRGDIPGAGAFASNMKSIGERGVHHFSMPTKAQQWKDEKTKSEKVENEGEEFGEDVEEGFMQDKDDDKGDAISQEKSDDQQIKDYKKRMNKIIGLVDEIVEEVMPKKGDPEERADKAKKTKFILKFALENPHFTKNSDIPVPANSTSYFTQNESKMKEQGIETVREFQQLMSKSMFDKISSQMAQSLEWAPARAAKLSHQLLKRAASVGKLNMLGMVCGVMPAFCNVGKVMVFERNRPRFSHVFNWKINEGKILIANVEDPDQEHINEAYQTAFEAVQQEVLMNNMEEQMAN